MAPGHAYQTALSGDWLEVTPVAVHDSAGRHALSGNAYDHFRVEVSPAALTAVEGRVVSTSASSLLYQYDLTFEVVLNAFTTYSWEDAVYSASPTHTSVEWFRYATYQIDWLDNYHWQPWVAAAATYRSYELRPPGGAHYWDLELGVDLNLPAAQTLPEIGNVTVSVAPTSGSVISGRAASEASTAALETYSQQFAGVGQSIAPQVVDYGAARSAAQAPSSQLSTDLAQELAAALVQESVGIEVTAPSADPGTWPTRQQGEWRAPSENSLLPAVGAAYLWPVELKPHVAAAQQVLEVTRAVMEIRTFWFWGEPDGAVTDAVYDPTDTRTATCAVRTENRVVQQTLEFTAELFAEVDMTAELADAWLGLPTAERGDMVWDLLVTGDTAATVAFLDDYDWGDLLYDVGVSIDSIIGGWVSPILWVVVAIVIVYAAVKVAIPYASRKAKGGAG